MAGQLSCERRGTTTSTYDDAATGNDEDYLLSRLRLGFTWAPRDNVTGAIELQDARIAGEEAINPSSSSEWGPIEHSMALPHGSSR